MWPVAHIFVLKKINEKRYLKASCDLFYGSIAPDISATASPQLKLNLAIQTHGFFEKLEKVAVGSRQSLFALGFATHNSAWGVDFHGHGPWYDPSRGYVHRKARELSKETGLSHSAAHIFIEAAIDILIRCELYRAAGLRVLWTALCRPSYVPEVLVRAFARSGEEKNEIVKAEKRLRGLLVLYGYALLRRPLSTIRLVSKALCKGLRVEPDLSLKALRRSIELCQDSYQEIIVASIKKIREHLAQGEQTEEPSSHREAVQARW